VSGVALNVERTCNMGVLSDVQNKMYNTIQCTMYNTIQCTVYNTLKTRMFCVGAADILLYNRPVIGVDPEGAKWRCNFSGRIVSC
jgi:hypothetical protein